MRGDGLKIGSDGAAEIGLGHWVKTASAYLAAGNKIPLPVKHTDDPEANRGWARELFSEGDSLFATVDLVGEGIKLAGTCDVSVYSPTLAVDGEGNRFAHPIVHIALCTDPVITGLSGFVPIETSRGMEKFTTQVPVLKLQEQIMPDVLPVPAPVADPAAAGGTDPAEAIVAAIMEKVTAMVKDKTKTAQEKKVAFGDLMKKLEKALGVFEDATADPNTTAVDAAAVAASRAAQAAATPDPFMVGLARDKYTGKLDALVASGKITKAARDDLAAQYLADAPLTLALSSKSTAQLDGLIAALDKNVAAVGMGERTGPQSLALARNIPVGDEKAKSRAEAGKEIMAMTARAAGMPSAKT